CLCIGLCLLLQGVGLGPLGRPQVATGLLCAWLALTAVLLWQHTPAIDHHAAARAETADTVEAIRVAIAAGTPGADVRIDNRRFLAAGPFNLLNPTTFPGWAALFTIFFPANSVDG